LRRRVGGGVGVGVLLEQGAEERSAPFEGPLRALVEGDERVGVVGGEQEVEGRSRLAEELLAELFTGGAGGSRVVVQDGSSGVADQRMGLYYPDGPGAATGMDPALGMEAGDKLKAVP
jgi:hypothetical protein